LRVLAAHSFETWYWLLPAFLLSLSRREGKEAPDLYPSLCQGQIITSAGILIDFGFHSALVELVSGAILGMRRTLRSMLEIGLLTASFHSSPEVGNVNYILSEWKSSRGKPGPPLTASAAFGSFNQLLRLRQRYEKPTVKELVNELGERGRFSRTPSLPEHIKSLYKELSVLGVHLRPIPLESLYISADVIRSGYGKTQSILSGPDEKQVNDGADFIASVIDIEACLMVTAVSSYLNTSPMELAKNVETEYKSRLVPEGRMSTEFRTKLPYYCKLLSIENNEKTVTRPQSTTPT
jgi:hypothetical protein